MGKKVGFFNVFCSSQFFANVITLMANNKEKGRLADKQEEEKNKESLLKTETGTDRKSKF